MTEKYNRDVIPIFLAFASSMQPLKKSIRTRLLSWLKLFKNFSNPKALYSSDALQKLFLTYVSHPDRSLQTNALECLFAYRTPGLTRHSDTLRLLLDDTSWRSQLTTLDLNKLEEDRRSEFVPVLIRIFYGLMLEHGGRGKGVHRRAALLSTLSACRANELNLLVDLMMEPLAGQLYAKDNLDLRPGQVKREVTVPEKQQIGFLVLLGEVLKHLGTHITGEWPRLFTICLNLTSNAQRRLQATTEVEIDEVQEEDPEGQEEDNGSAASGASLRQMRYIRQLGLKRIADFFRLSADFDFRPYMLGIYEKIISPRLSLLDQENTQAPSALLELLDQWSTRPDYASYLVQYDPRTLPKIFDCLIASNVKPSVANCILDITERLLIFVSEDESLKDILMSPYISHLLSNLTILAQRAQQITSSSGSNVLSFREIELLSKLSPYITNGDEAATLLSLFLPQFRKARKAIPDRTKVNMLSILCNLIPNIINDKQTLTKTYETLSYLLQIYRGKQVRTSVLDCLNAYSTIDKTTRTVADLLSSLNAYSPIRMEDPDFDTRLKAFTDLNTNLWKTLSEKQWTPVIHNMLFFIQDENELSIRTNASLAIKRFVDVAAASEGDSMQMCWSRILLPGLKHSLKAKSELVRSEAMGILSFAVEKGDCFGALKDMSVLLASGDEEVNFFNNIFHIQIHRRTRALRRLAEYCDEPGFRSSTLQEIFVPIVKSFIAGTGTIDHHLVNEAILTLGRIAKHLTWSAYYALVRQYLRLIKDGLDGGRTYTRALVAVLENFHFSLEDNHVDEAELGQGDSDDEAAVKEDVVQQALPADVKIRDAINDRLLPALLKHLEHRDGVEDENRIPIAVGVAFIAVRLPGNLREQQISRLLLILSPIFRSKAQSTRDMARGTLCRIAVVLGLTSLPAITRHLREALFRGPHLHILAFVVHALLTHVTSPEYLSTFNKLDNCVSDAVHVSAEVIFGRSGKDVQSDTFRSKMKEVKGSSSKGMDTFAVLAKYITPSASRELLLPLKAIMQETESAKTMQAVEEILRRISGGFIGNENFSSTDILMFCHTLISQNARFFQQNLQTKKRKTKGKKVEDAIVQLRRNAEVHQDHYSHNSWR